MSDILCLGEPMVEFTRERDGRYLRGIGGDTSNAAIAAARQGAAVGYVSALGDDRFGQAIREIWTGEGIDHSAVRTDPAAPTGIYFIDPDPEGRFFTYYRTGSAASRMTPGDLDSGALAHARILHLSGITLAVSDDLRRTAFAAMAAARTVSLDTNLRLKLWSADDARRITHDAAVKADVLVTSIDDSTTLTGLDAPPDIAGFYHDLGPRIVLVTRGGDGAYLSVEGAGTAIDPAPTTPVDSTGAGDSFSGAFLAWWLETGDPVLAARRAAVVAAGTVAGLGAVAPIPHRADVLAAMGG